MRWPAWRWRISLIGAICPSPFDPFLRLLFGKSLSGPVDNIVYIVAVVATVLAVATTLGFGVQKFVAGLHRLGIGDWVLNAEGTGSNGFQTSIWV